MTANILGLHIYLFIENIIGDGLNEHQKTAVGLWSTQADTISSRKRAM